MIGNISEETEELKVKVAIGALYTELNTILRKIRGRFIAEPTKAERERILETKEEIKKLKNDP